jgi:hypothetical protein
MEAADAGGAGAFGQRDEQRDPDSPPLPAIDHFDRHLGGLEVVIDADVAGDRDRRARRGRERDHRLVVPVVDVEEETQLAGREGALGREVALVTGALAEMAEREDNCAVVGGDELADRDRRHHTTLNASQTPYVRTRARAPVRSVSYT